jgi:glutathione S-transferase
MTSITFYHSVESTCAHKVRLVMAEKRLDWQEKLVNLRKGEQFHPDYLRLNPKAVVPTLVHHREQGDVVLRESTIINEYLDETFIDPPLKPNDPALCAQMRLWVKSIDEEVHPSTGISTYAIALRHQMNSLKTAAELEQHFAAIPDPGRRQRQRSVHEQGEGSEPFTLAIQRLYTFIEELNQQLGKTPWLVGEHYSLADAAALPYVMRLDNLTFDFMWQDKPSLLAWYKQSLSRDNAADLLVRNRSLALDALIEKHGAAARSKVETLIANRK